MNSCDEEANPTQGKASLLTYFERLEYPLFSESISLACLARQSHTLDTYVISFPEQRRQGRNKKRAGVCDETKLEVDNTTAVQNAPWNQGDMEVLTRLARDWQIVLTIIQI